MWEVPVTIGRTIAVGIEIRVSVRLQMGFRCRLRTKRNCVRTKAGPLGEWKSGGLSVAFVLQKGEVRLTIVENASIKLMSLDFFLLLVHEREFPLEFLQKAELFKEFKLLFEAESFEGVQ